MHWFVAWFVFTTGWTVAPGPPLPYVGYHPVRMMQLGDGRLVFDPEGPPLILAADASGWVTLGRQGLWGRGPDVALVDGRVLTAQSSGGALLWDLATGNATRTGDLVLPRQQT